MKFAVAFLTTALSLSPMLAGAHRPLAKSPPAPPQTQSSAGDAAAPLPQGKHANLTEMLTLDGPFHTFLRYLQQTNLVEVFENQAYRTDQGITIFVPVDRAFAAVKPSVLSGLSKDQLKNLMMYHSLAKHYALAEFDGLSQSNPVTTLAGGQYTVNVTNDAGIVHVRSRWASAKIFGSVSATAPMGVYELDRVLLPDALFRAQPPVAATPPVPTPAPSEGYGASVPDADAASASDGVAPAPDRKVGEADAESSACRAGARFASYAAAAASGAMTLVALSL